MAQNETRESGDPTSDKRSCQEVLPNSPPNSDEKGVSRVLSLVRKLSISKKTESEDPETEDIVGASNAKSPSSEAQELGFLPKLLRKGSSFKKKMSKPLQEISESVPKSAMPKRDNSKEMFNQSLPLKPLSVMQINKLIQDKFLEEAHKNLLSLRLEVQHERSILGVNNCSVELANKEEDLNLLYKTLKIEMTEIVRHSCNLPCPNKELLVLVASIIEKEERKGDVDGWRYHWTAAVQDGVKETLNTVSLEGHEQNSSWIAVHLELLGKKIVEQLVKVKAELVNLYPPSFDIFETYASSCHEFVGERLNCLLQKVREPKDFEDMLDFITSYHSEKILGSPVLQPEIKLMQKSVTLSNDLVDQIEKAYCDCLQNNLHGSLDNIIITEQEQVWSKKETPKKTDDGKFFISQVHKNVCKWLRKYTENNQEINANLRKNIVVKCIETLKHFPKRFQEEFSKHSCSFLGSDSLDCCLWAGYHVAYINSFSFLKQDIETYRESNPHQVEQFEVEVNRLVDQLRQALLNQFKAESEPHLGRMMTKKWFSTDADFRELTNIIEIYSGHSKSMRPPQAQVFASDMHYHVVKGYISQLLKGQYSCKGKSNDIAATKIRQQWGELRKLYSEMGSTLQWLHPLGDYLSDIIEQKNEKDLKTFLTPLVENYPDISKKQFLAILNFRDKSLGFGRSPAIQHFTNLKQTAGTSENPGNQEHLFFSDIK